MALIAYVGIKQNDILCAACGYRYGQHSAGSHRCPNPAYQDDVLSTVSPTVPRFLETEFIETIELPKYTGECPCGISAKDCEYHR